MSASASTVCRQLTNPFFCAVVSAMAIALPAIALDPTPLLPDLTTSKPALTKSFTKGTVYAGELNLSGLTLNTTESEVYSLLGPPKSREISPTSYIDEILYYGGISVALSGGMVWDIIATSPKFCTPSGVCPGDSIDLVFDTLGFTALVPSGGSQRAIYAAPSMGSCALNLDVVAESVSRIVLACQ